MTQALANLAYLRGKTDGRRAAFEDVARWHEGQSAIFGRAAESLERDGACEVDVMRAKWASASHAAHAVRVRKMAIEGCM